MNASTIEKDRSNGLTAVFAVFSVALLVAFFSYRGSDVGQLGRLLSGLAAGPVFGFDGFRDSAVGTLAALLIGTSWFGVGSFVWAFLPKEDGQRQADTLNFTMKTAMGAAAWSLVWFFFGLAGAYSQTIALTSLIIGVVLAGLQFRRPAGGGSIETKAGKTTLVEKFLIALAAVPVTLAFIASLAPPIAKDTLLYHFAVPKAYIASGNNAFIEGNIASYLALGTEMHAVWAMLLGGLVSERAGEAAAGATIFLFFPLLLLAVYGWSREIGLDRLGAIVAALAVACIPTAFHVASSGYIDLALALFITLAVAALCRWWNSPHFIGLILVAVFLGAALSIKLTALFAFAAIALLVLLRARNAEGAAGKIVINGLAALLFAGVIASPWYLRTWKETGSPVFPFYMSVWKGEAPGWNVERSNLFQAMNTQYGGADEGGVNYLTAPVRVSISAQPEQARYFDGVLGPAFLLGVFILALGLWKFELPLEVKVASGVAGILLAFWLFSSQQLRYLLPLVPLVAVAVVATTKWMGEAIGDRRRLLLASFAVAAAAPVLVTSAWFLQKAPHRVVLGGEAKTDYLARNLDYYPFYQALNADSPESSRVWLINMRRDTYHLDRPYISDYLFEDWTLRQMVWESRNVEELRARAAAMGVQYVLARHDFLFDRNMSTLVDDKRPGAENDAKLKMAQDFILDTKRTVRADNKFSLVRIF